MKCGWCDQLAVREVEIKPPVYTGVGKRRRIIKLAQMVPVCWDHKDIVNIQPRFYTCGCSYVEGHDKCPIHDNGLTKNSRLKDD